MRIGTFRTAVVIVAYLALAVSYFFMVRLHVKHRPAGIHERMTDEQLQSWYAFYNSTVFDDALPANVEITWADLDNDLGEEWRDASGTYRIRIDRTLNPAARQAKMTVLHEQCHIVTEGQELEEHGPKFQNCMLYTAEQHALDNLW